MPRTSLKQRASEFEPVKKAVEQHSDIDEVRINVGMPMEFDPRKGETPKPDGIEFTIPHEDFGLIRHISNVCEDFGMKVRTPAYKQPGFTHKGRTYEKEYAKFVRLVPQR